MAIIKMKPTSAGRRGMVRVVTEGLYKGAAYAPLLENKALLRVVITMVISLHAIKAVVTNTITVLLILNAIKTVFLQK